MHGAKRVRIFIQVALLSLAVAAPAVAADKLTIRSPASFADGTYVRDAVKNECHLLTSVPEYIQQAAAANFSEVVLSPDATSKTRGLVLITEVSELQEMGNRFMGRRKAMTVKGELFENGKSLGTFTAHRDTAGGIVGGYMGDCAFFFRCAKTIGNDIAGWLLNPGKDSMLP